MSTKFPLTLLMMEMEEELREKGVQAELHWVNRDSNQERTTLRMKTFPSSRWRRGATGTRLARSGKFLRGSCYKVKDFTKR